MLLCCDSCKVLRELGCNDDRTHIHYDKGANLVEEMKNKL